jgi:hypothetical protein
VICIGELFFGQPLKLDKARAALQRLRDRGGRTLSKLPHMLHILPSDTSATGGDIDGDSVRDGSSSSSSSSSNSVNDSSSRSNRIDDNKEGDNEDDEKDEDGVELTRLPDESEEAFLVRNCRCVLMCNGYCLW